MTGLFGGGEDADDEPDDESEREQCSNCGRMVPEDEMRDDGYCKQCGDSKVEAKCPRCGATAITAEIKDNPKGYETHAPGTITIRECQGCGYRSGFRHDWKWK